MDMVLWHFKQVNSGYIMPEIVSSFSQWHGQKKLFI